MNNRSLFKKFAKLVYSMREEWGASSSLNIDLTPDDFGSEDFVVPPYSIEALTDDFVDDGFASYLASMDILDTDFNDLYAHPLALKRSVCGVASSFFKVGATQECLKARYFFKMFRKSITSSNALLPFPVGYKASSFKEVVKDKVTSSVPFLKRFISPVFDDDKPMGEIVFDDLVKLPHLLVAGLTRGGKSNFMRMIMLGLLMSVRREHLRVVVLDGRGNDYKLMASLTGIGSLGTGHYSSSDIPLFLQELVKDMHNRNISFGDIDVLDIEEYNDHCLDIGKPCMPYIVVFFDEAARWTMMPPVADAMKVLVAEGRKHGIHIISGWQRPSTTSLSGDAKANFPATACFKVRDNVNSSVVFGDGTNANPVLLPVGQLLYRGSGALEHLASPYMPTPMLKAVVANVATQLQEQV